MTLPLLPPSQFATLLMSYFSLQIQTCTGSTSYYISQFLCTDSDCILQLGLPKQLFAALESKAASEGKSVSQVAREALQTAIA